MGLVCADLELISSDDLALHCRGYIPDTEIKRVQVNALVDSGSYLLVINETIKLIDPKQQRLIVNPRSPHIARKHLK